MVEPAALTKVSALGIEERRLNVVMDLLDPPSDRVFLGHGYQVNVRIVVWKGEDVLTVPLIALFRFDVITNRYCHMALTNPSDSKVVADPGA